MPMKVQSTIQKWGNSLALRLTGPIKTIPHFENNMQVNIEIEEGYIKIYPVKEDVKTLPFSEKDLLKDLDSKTAHAECLAHVKIKEMGD